jgi:hypothetical protein
MGDWVANANSGQGRDTYGDYGWDATFAPGYTNVSNIAGQGVGAFFGDEAGGLVNQASMLGSMLGFLPKFMTKLVQTNVGPTPELYNEAAAQARLVSTVPMKSMGRQLMSILKGDPSTGVLGDAGHSLIGFLDKVIPQSITSKLPGKTADVPLDKYLQTLGSKDLSKAELVVGMIAATAAQNFPKAAEFFKGLMPGVIVDATPLHHAYMASTGGKGDAAGFDSFVQNFQASVSSGQFSTLRDEQGNPVPGSMPAQTAANAAKYAALHLPKGSSPETVMAATKQVTGAIQDIVNIASKNQYQQLANPDMAFRLLRSSPQANQILNDPKAATAYLDNMLQMASSAGLPAKDVMGAIAMSERSGGRFTAAQALQSTVSAAVLNRDFMAKGNYDGMAPGVMSRMSGTVAQKISEGVGGSDNLKLLAAAAQGNTSFQAALDKAFKAGDAATVSKLIEQAKADPKAWQNKDSVNPAYLNSLLQSDSAIRSVMQAEARDVAVRANAPELLRMSAGEFKRRVSTGDFSGLSPQAQRLMNDSAWTGAYARSITAPAVAMDDRATQQSSWAPKPPVAPPATQPVKPAAPPVAAAAKPPVEASQAVAANAPAPAPTTKPPELADPTRPNPTKPLANIV